MNFISVEFVGLFLITSIIYRIFPKKFKWTILFIANIIFYIYGNGFLALFLLGSIITIYIGGLLLKKCDRKKELFKSLNTDEKHILKRKIKTKKRIILISTIILNLSILILLKYDNFIISIFNSFLSTNFPFKNFILPLGISYYTLEAISYILDIYNGKIEAETNIFKVFLYLSFFPLMIEGPISRYSEMGKQLYEPHNIDFNTYKNGLILIIWGYLKKLVIADRAAIFVNNVFSQNCTGLVVLIASILYVVQIYTEFSGCMDIVTGVSELFGIKVPDNFRRPFFSISINEFWRRWHITLGTWLRDYIFYPLSISNLNMKIILKTGKLNKNIAKAISLAIPLFFVWFIMGLWHGASVKYILYGLYYYAIIMLGILFKSLFDKLLLIFKIKTSSFKFKLFQILRTDLLVLIGMTIFRANTFKSAFIFLLSIFHKSNISILNLGINLKEFILLIIMLVIIFIVDLLNELGFNIRTKLDNMNIAVRWAIYMTLIFSLLTFGIYGYGYNVSDFIYGGF